jgi:hypothetical protein
MGCSGVEGDAEGQVEGEGDGQSDRTKAAAAPGKNNRIAGEVSRSRLAARSGMDQSAFERGPCNAGIKAVPVY